MKIFVTLLAIFALASAVSGTRIPRYCNPDNADFQIANAAQLDAISANPMTDLWFQNITIYAPDQYGSFSAVTNYGYWQRRTYNRNICSFEEPQLWYRDANTVVVQQINSVVDPPRRLVPSMGNGRVFARQSWTVSWVTPFTFDSAALATLPVESFAIGSDVVFVNFQDPASSAVVYSEELRVVTPGQRRFYSQPYTVAPGQLPILVIFDSFVVPGAFVPPLISQALDAFDDDLIPLSPDPAGLAVGVSLPVYLFSLPALARSAPDEFTPRDFTPLPLVLERLRN